MRKDSNISYAESLLCKRSQTDLWEVDEKQKNCYNKWSTSNSYGSYSTVEDWREKWAKVTEDLLQDLESPTNDMPLFKDNYRIAAPILLDDFIYKYKGDNYFLLHYKPSKSYPIAVTPITKEQADTIYADWQLEDEYDLQMPRKYKALNKTVLQISLWADKVAASKELIIIK